MHKVDPVEWLQDVLSRIASYPINRIKELLPHLRIEQLENDSGEISYVLKSKANGYGTRQSGERVRNEILNIYREANKVIVIDFDGIAVISSSFADELIGKLVIEFGFFGFNNIVRLKNMNSLIQSIVQRSVAQRMAESATNQ